MVYQSDNPEADADISWRNNIKIEKERTCPNCNAELKEINYSLIKEPSCVIYCKNCGYTKDEWGVIDGGRK